MFDLRWISTAFGIVFIAAIAYSAVGGSIRPRGFTHPIRRADNPVLFWIFIAFFLAGGLLFVIGPWLFPPRRGFCGLPNKSVVCPINAATKRRFRNFLGKAAAVPEDD
jgi:hypothetical protein